MKKLLCLALTIALTLTLCAGFAATADEQVNLVWFTEQKNDLEFERAMQYIVEPFQEKFPNVKVELAPTADYEQVLKIQLSAGAGPDICNMGGPSITAEFVGADKVLDLTDFAKESGLDDQIFQWALDSCKVNGKLYSLPNSYEALLLWINEDMFAANGWTVPTNYAELEAFCTEAQAKGIIPIAFGTSNFKAINEQFVSVALACYAGRNNVKEALSGNLPWTDPVFVDAINCLNDMWQKGWINDKKSHAISSDDANALFFSQQAATIMTGTWALGDFATQIQDFEYTGVAFPSLQDGVPACIPMGAGGVVAINAATEHPEEAKEFLLNWFTNTQMHAQAVAAGEQTLPIAMDTSLFPDTMNAVDKEIIALLNQGLENMDTAGHVMWTYWPAETRLYMMDNIEKIYLGELSVEDYLAESQRLFEKEFAEGLVPTVS